MPLVLLAAALGASPAVAAPPATRLDVFPSADTAPRSAARLQSGLNEGRLAACLDPGTFGRVTVTIDDAGVRVRGADSPVGACLVKAVGHPSARLGPLRAGIEVLRAPADAPGALEAFGPPHDPGVLVVWSRVPLPLELTITASPLTAAVEVSPAQAEGYLECLRGPLDRGERLAPAIDVVRNGDVFATDGDADVRLDRCLGPVLAQLQPNPVSPRDARLKWRIRPLPLEGKLGKPR